MTRLAFAGKCRLLSAPPIGNVDLAAAAKRFSFINDDKASAPRPVVLFARKARRVEARSTSLCKKLCIQDNFITDPVRNHSSSGKGMRFHFGPGIHGGFKLLPVVARDKFVHVIS